MRIENLQNENRKYAKSIGNFHVLEYVQDSSVSPMNAMNEYFMSKMNVWYWNQHINTLFLQTLENGVRPE